MWVQVYDLGTFLNFNMRFGLFYNLVHFDDENNTSVQQFSTDRSYNGDLVYGP